MAEKKERFLTPMGEIKWAHVHKPQPPFKGDPSKGAKYTVDLVFSVEDPAWKEWASKLKAKVDALPEQVDKKTGEVLRKQIPIKRELDESDKPTGRFYATFKTGEQYRPGVFDRYKRAIPETVMIGNGSKGRVSYVESPYDGFGGGIALYMNAIQVWDLVEYQSRSADSFGFDGEPLPADAPEYPSEPAPIGKTVHQDPAKLPPDHPDYLPF
jgi:hypothetical protein